MPGSHPEAALPMIMKRRTYNTIATVLFFLTCHLHAAAVKPGTNGRLDLALYSSFTVRNGKPVLWYPERKFFLSGRLLPAELTPNLKTSIGKE
jgi:hypothetical protein